MALFSFGGTPTVSFGDLSLTTMPEPNWAQPRAAGCEVIPTQQRFSVGNVVQAQRVQPSPAKITTPDGATARGSALGENRHAFPFVMQQPGRSWLAGNWTFELSPDPPVSIKARAPIHWTSKASLSQFSVDRDFVLEWIPPASSSSEEFVQFTYTQFANPPVGHVSAIRVFCSQPLAAGRLVVPSALIRSIPWSSSPPGLSFTAAWAQLQTEVSREADGRHIVVQYRQSHPY
jgi:hypothetical protein